MKVRHLKGVKTLCVQDKSFFFFAGAHWLKEYATWPLHCLSQLGKHDIWS